jgi:hypothetical protein
MRITKEFGNTYVIHATGVLAGDGGKLYSVALNWMANNGLVNIDDHGITQSNTIAKPDNLISAMLKHDTEGIYDGNLLAHSVNGLFADMAASVSQRMKGSTIEPADVTYDPKADTLAYNGAPMTPEVASGYLKAFFDTTGRGKSTAVKLAIYHTAKTNPKIFDQIMDSKGKLTRGIFYMPEQERYLLPAKGKPAAIPDLRLTQDDYPADTAE